MSGTPIDDPILVAPLNLGALTTRRDGPLHQAKGRHIAGIGTVPVVDLTANPPQQSLLNAADAAEYLRLGVLPFREDGDAVLFLTVEPSATVWEWAERKLRTRAGKPCRWGLVKRADLYAFVESVFPKELLAEARERLARGSPELSARDLKLGWGHGVALVIVSLPIAAYAQASWVPWVLLGCNVFYAAILIFKGLLFFAGRDRVLHHVPVYPPVPEDELPPYTVLVPMYRERDSLPALLSSLQRLDYPQDKLDIKLVVEADDRETLDALAELQPPAHIQIVRVPPGEPRTKPKACNYALPFAWGTYVTIYDAEDQPEPQQLKRAVAAFAALGPQVACLQARLNYFNRRENLLTRWFSIEYALWFDRWLPGLESLALPIPLGGTSNHVRRDVLQALCDWDPYNVTEDADLGVRLAANGFRTAMLDSDTEEEATLSTHAWIKQRSRWIKGYMQTYLVHMRDPVKLYRRAGAAGFWGVQFFIGLPAFLFLAAPLLWLFAAAWAAGWTPLTQLLPGWLVAIFFGNVLFSVGLHWYAAADVVEKRAWRGMVPAILTFPAYWVLHSVASFKALWQLIFRPHYWEKTTHGVSRYLVGKGMAAPAPTPAVKRAI